MARVSTIGTHCTTVRNSIDLVNPDRGTITHVTYHSTDVVVFDDLSVKLDNGGYWTATTKTRMNQAANQFGLGFQVYQYKKQWFVDTPTQEAVPFDPQGRIEFRRIKFQRN